MSNTKYIFVTGGVVSGLGKGITAASLGRLLKARGKKVTIQKFDPYINIDPGTMSPYQHGEVFVTDDGAETDLDLGHYERFVDENLNMNSNVTTGKIYQSVINKERKGDFLGGTVQVIPHITNEIKERIYRLSKLDHIDVVITEVGGTVGDIESLPFLEAIRQISIDIGRENVLYVHVTLVPQIGACGELKTKPTQHSVKELRNIGIQPDIIVCRTEKPLNKELREKIGLFCNLSAQNVIQNLTVDILYEAPIMLEKEGLAELACKKFGFGSIKPDLADWEEMVEKQKHLEHTVRIGLVGKYVELHDAYISIVESLKHAGIVNNAQIKIKWINSESVTNENIAEKLADIDGVLVPGGFGDRGIEGKITAVRYAREKKIPYFGICLGMQMAVIEFARNVLGFKDAHSTEFNSNTHYPVIDFLPEQRDIDEKGGTMRLGLYPCKIAAQSNMYTAYKEELIYERHRHRYEFNNDYRDEFLAKGFKITGVSPDERLVEAIEVPDHPWFVGVQYHPEFKSRPNKPHSLFVEFVKAAKNK
jgi:CTP synthase